MSSNMIPVCVKVACIKSRILTKQSINEKILKNILTSRNSSWEDDLLIVEEMQKHLFFSDEIFIDLKVEE